MADLKKVLVADDNDANILLFQVILENMGIEHVFTAASGEEALEMVEKEKIHMVITAWEMTGMAGTILIQKLRGNRKTMYLPCLIYSKRMKEDEVKLAQEIGFDNILAMPFNKEDAKNLVEKIIKDEENITPLEITVRKIEGFIADNKPAEALKMIGPSVTKKSPFRTRVKTAMGELWIMVQQYKKSEVVLTEALKEDPDYIPAKYMLARLYSIVGRHEDAIALLEESAKDSPHNMKTLLGLGSAYVDADEFEKASDVFGKVEKMDSTNAELRDEKGKMAFKEGDLPLAAQLLSETQNGDFLARQFNNMAIAESAAGKFGKSIKTYQSAINILTDKAKVHLLTFNMGLAYRKSGKLEKSFECMCESYIMEPGFEKAYSSLAKVSKELKEKRISLDLDLIKRVKEVRSEYKEKIESEQEDGNAA